MVIVFITADIEGTRIRSHELVIEPILNMLRNQGYDCRWGQWRTPWGRCDGVDDSQIQFFVTSDEGIPNNINPRRVFFLPHGLHFMERRYVADTWLGYLAPGEWWIEGWLNFNYRAGISDTGKEERMKHLPITGWPKMDVLFASGIREKVLSDLRGLPYDKTILYAPTGNWDWATSFDKSIEKIVSIFESLPYNLVIKPGERSTSFKKWDWLNNYFSRNPSNMRFLAKPQDVTPLYLIADVTITDGSSIAHEFMGLDKPTIQLSNMSDPMSSFCEIMGACADFPPSFLTHEEVDNESWFVNHLPCFLCGGTIKSTLEGLKDTIIRCIENPNEYADIRRKWAVKMNKYVDGKCTERCVEAIKRLGGV